MLPSPSSSPVHPARPALETCTNIECTPTQPKLSFAIPTPPDDRRPRKRKLSALGSKSQNIPKSLFSSQPAENAFSADDDSDVETDDTAMLRARGKRFTPIQRHRTFLSRPVGSYTRLEESTLSLLRSFVSSHKSDVFKCQSVDANSFLTPPYACSYTHSARNGSTPLLAVATEQGTIHVLNTARRKDWDIEPQRTSLQLHHNGVFDVKWNMTDTLLATCSGDQSTRITSVEHETITHVLHGHSGTVKCVSWDSKHSDLLATGGRDGAICLWDLRVGEKRGTDSLTACAPVITIPGAHEDLGKPKPRRGKKNVPAPKSVTSLLYPESDIYGLVSSGSADGVLRYWDLRTPPSTRKTKTAKPRAPSCLYSTAVDPTVLHGSKRSRGLISVAVGTGPTAGLIFALGVDSRIHTFTLPSLDALPIGYTHPGMQTNSFYVGLAVSPCGRWLGSGGTGTKGSNFLFDISNAASPQLWGQEQEGIELRGQRGEVGALDWAENALATCADDGTVRVWRPDVEVYRSCQEDPEEKIWDWSWCT
ncbi:WD40-repeat-containing domain protein [Cyathus striatus]|nr:WD40-repeat-containing domain protein [Cyathus striatus]